jgi:hypothetical protein
VKVCSFGAVHTKECGSGFRGSGKSNKKVVVKFLSSNQFEPSSSYQKCGDFQNGVSSVVLYSVIVPASDFAELEAPNPV